MGVDPAVLGKVLAARLADIRAAAARYDAFAFDERPATGGSDGGDPAATARDLVLAALGAAAEPLSYAMLHRMAGGDVPLPELSAVTGLPRLAVWERLNGLVAVGLVGRSHEHDGAGLTPAGRALVELVEGAVAAASGELPA